MRVKEAKKILPKSEYEAFEAILMRQTSRMSDAKLKQRATLSRRLRDKNRDLAKRRAASVRTRRTNETDTRVFDRRASIFQSIIDHLETELGKPRRQTVGRKADSKASAKKIAKSRGPDSRLKRAKVRRALTEAKHRTRH